MPGLSEHELISLLLAGSRGTAVHAALDKPFSVDKLKWLLGREEVEAYYRMLSSADSSYTRGHRQAFHSPVDAVVIGNLLGGPEGARVALSHLLADEVFHTAEAKQWLRLLTAGKRRRRD